ncbi:FtsB family cell division protein [Pediococcus pentosaceus]|uniref:FtsB family cell division protein n=1 Tax=Pediococcus pentosaceus TaxID=1255 RepID=UPI000258B298|nr:septum formation initiator family protein [Pediococcus pentosaceus]MCE5959501.1 septum formation initiator family protein [Pediococcus pentosaceus]MCS8568948.1 septum formation initiator family protein [Pediococcus pentosaceus]CCG89745.1 septum formation initiator family protein [Pediococcus pentosaceus IE-3]
MENVKKNKRSMKARTATGAVNPYARARKQRALFILGVFAIIATIFIFQIVHAHISRSSVNNKLAMETAHYEKIQNDNKALKVKVKQMNDEQYLEKLIRSKYLYTKKGETVYNLSNDAK